MLRTLARIGLVTGVTVLAVGVTSAPAGGQGRGQGMRMEERGPLRMLPELSGFAPEAVLARAASLDLTEAQRRRLETIVRERDGLVEEARTAHDESRNALRAASADPPDLTRIGRAFWGAHAAMGKKHWARLEAAFRARAVLTPAQRERVQGS